MARRWLPGWPWVLLGLILAHMARRWPQAEFVHAPQRVARYAARIFTPELWRKEDPLKIVLIGADFELRVWQTLLKLPMGRAVRYGEIAAHGVPLGSLSGRGRDRFKFLPFETFKPSHS